MAALTEDIKHAQQTVTLINRLVMQNHPLNSAFDSEVAILKSIFKIVTALDFTNYIIKTINLVVDWRSHNSTLFLLATDHISLTSTISEIKLSSQ